MKRIAVLISGGGSNLQSIIDATRQHKINAEIAVVISNKAEAFGLTRARQANINTEVLDHHDYPTREAFDQVLVDRLESYQPDLIVLAGFMRILTPVFVDAFHGRTMNIHPSLLPAYPGLHTHKRAIDAGDHRAGATVHFVTRELDGGPHIIQASVPILPG
ncbi:MAG: phosphoribosylglycinamide formyltransferase, partial [Pseudomonadales bacterium]|nr:phosphoribosylglycinamide formyltransferase [Pseudomonadales bacterium]